MMGHGFLVLSPVHSLWSHRILVFKQNPSEIDLTRNKGEAIG